MALFSEELFEIFEEKSDPVSLTGKKRKRPDIQTGDKKQEADKKKSRVDEREGGDGSSTDQPMVIEDEGLSEPPEGLAAGEDDLTKEEPM
jgi:hypothetical protein